MGYSLSSSTVFVAADPESSLNRFRRISEAHERVSVSSQFSLLKSSDYKSGHPFSIKDQMVSVLLGGLFGLSQLLNSAIVVPWAICQ